MAKQNRIEIGSAVSTKVVPVMTTSVHRDVLNNEIGASVVFKKDVKGTQNASGLAIITVDFASNDTVSITNITQNFSISVTNLADGERNFIEVNKLLENTISFSGGILDQTPSKNYVDASLTKVVYEITQKNGVVYANALTQNLHEASLPETLDGTSSKFVTPEKLQTNVWYEVGNDGGNTSYTNGWSLFTTWKLSYKIDIFGNLIIQGQASGATATSGAIFKFNDLSIIPNNIHSDEIPIGIAGGIRGSASFDFTSIYLKKTTGSVFTNLTGWSTAGDRIESRNWIVYNQPDF